MIPYQRFSASGLLKSEDWGLKFSDSTLNKIYDLEDYIRSKCLLPINEATNRKYHVKFLVRPTIPNHNFRVEIFTEDENDYQTIVDIIKSNIDSSLIHKFSREDFDLALFGKEPPQAVAS